VATPRHSVKGNDKGAPSLAALSHASFGLQCFLQPPPPEASPQGPGLCLTSVPQGPRWGWPRLHRLVPVFQVSVANGAPCCSTLPPCQVPLGPSLN
jgi:hypothetical protein